MKGTVLLALAGLSAIGALTPLAAHAAGLNEIAAYRLIAESEARRAGVPRQIVDAVMRVESGYNPMASGLAGEVGLMQILPGTAAMLGFRGTMDELREPTTNIRLGVAYLSQAWRLAGGDLCTTVMKYRAGHGETRFSYLSVEYCRRIRAHLATLGFPIDGPRRPPPSAFRCRWSAMPRSPPTPTVQQARSRRSGTASARVAQPGKRFGACISKSSLRGDGIAEGWVRNSE